MGEYAGEREERVNTQGEREGDWRQKERESVWVSRGDGEKRKENASGTKGERGRECGCNVGKQYLHPFYTDVILFMAQECWLVMTTG